MAVQPKITVEDFEAFIALPENSDQLFELIAGEIVEKLPTQEHGYLASLLNAEIYHYLKNNPIGMVVVEVRHRLPDDDLNSYMPDVSFTSSERTGRWGG